ncbi:cell division protein FtsK [Rhodobacterales bacterium 59_46_T64]|nr:cell division protein FtsK [Rhodobacterales bacterium 59_46_T64]
MAYQARGRDPLFDSNMQAAIEKRGKELLGLGLMFVGLLAAAMIYSYSPDDPNFMMATDAPVKNWLGRIGASIAAPLLMIVGLGTWAVALVLLAWGARFALHRGQERAMGRVIFAPIWIAVVSVYAASLTPGDLWGQTHDFGLGGHFGDTVLSALFVALPFGNVFAVKLLSLIFFAATLTVGAFVLGFTKLELARIGRFLLVGLIMSYAMLLNALGRGAKGARTAAAALKEKTAARRAARAEWRAEEAAWLAQQEAEMAAAHPAQTQAAPAVHRHAYGAETTVPYGADDGTGGYDDGSLIEEPAPQRPEKPSLLSRMPTLIKRADPAPMPEPELVEPQALEYHDMDPAQGDARIKAKIADAVKSRVRSGGALTPPPSAPLTRGRGHGPQPLLLNAGSNGPQAGLPPEPPLTAAHVAGHAAMQAAAPIAADAAAAGPLSMQMTPAADATRIDASIAQDAPLQEAVPTERYAEATPRIYDGGYTDDIAPIPADTVPAPHVPEDHHSFSAQGYVPGAAGTDTGPIPVPEAKKVVQHTPRKAPQKSTRAKAEAQPSLQFEDSGTDFELPPLQLLSNAQPTEHHHLSDEALEENARMLESVLDDYGVKGEIVSVRPGPVVTMYELEPAPGLKASRVIGLADDIARSMSALSARVSTVPGRSVIGIELPNDHREMVSFREILSSREYGDGTQKLPLALGKDIGGDPVVANLAKMPHLLIAGTTGSGKSVAINTMILSLLYKLTPDECRLIMIDPKMLELSVYDGIPHLLSPVVTDPKKAVVALKWVVGEMEERYRKMSKMGVRNIDGYNGRVADALAKGEMFTRTVQTGFDDETGEPVFETEENQPEKMPYIVVVVDEMADLMMVAGKEIEACIQRLAQMARASGIHLIMATQRPSVDVITGTIKANFPTRISFQVTSKIDSRTILGEMGAEQLLGMGDMLYMAGGARITRCHGPFVSDEEVEEVVNHLKSYGPPSYIGGVVEGPPEGRESDIDAVLGLNTGGNTDGEDALYDTAVAIVIKDRKCSTSYIQRKLAIGYNKAARLVEQMEDEGVVSSANHVGKREILVPEQH